MLRRVNVEVTPKGTRGGESKRIVQAAPNYAAYETKTDREIPLVRAGACLAFRLRQREAHAWRGCQAHRDHEVVFGGRQVRPAGARPQWIAIHKVAADDAVHDDVSRISVERKVTIG